MTTATTSWIVLLAHGSRDARWRQPVEELARRVAAGPSGPLTAVAYLQFCPPDLEQTLRDCHARGATRVLVVPVFISGGGHLLRDVPEAIAAAAAAVPGLGVSASGALGEEPEVQQALARACLRLAAGAAAAPGESAEPGEAEPTGDAEPER